MLLTAENTKPPSREHKKLIVLHNFTNLETCGCIMKQLNEASTDIIIVSNEIKDDIVNVIHKNLTRGCDLIDVTNLHPTDSKQRMVYGLFENHAHSPSDDDRNAFAIFSEDSKNITTIVHMLTSLLQITRSTKEVRRSIFGIKGKVSSENVATSEQHSVEILLTRILNSNDFCSPAQHLLQCLSIVGSIPLPFFYVIELSKLIIESTATKEGKLQKSAFVPKQIINQLEQGRVIRKFPNPIVYHKDFNPRNMDPNIQQIFIPELICDAVKSKMRNVDKIECLENVQHTIRNISNSSTLDKVHLHYTRMLYDELHKICVEQILDPEFVVAKSVNLDSHRIVKCYPKGIT